MSRTVVTRAEVEPPAPTTPARGPSIAVLVSLNFPDMTEHVADLVRRFTRTALETLVATGAAYHLLDSSLPLLDPGIVAEYDGLLLLGGGDIDGELAGHPGVAPNSYGVDRRADEDAIAAIHAAAAAEVPVLGICRGSQLINVAYGGTVLPDIEDYRLHRGGAGSPLFLDERVRLVPGSRLEALLGVSELVVRSGHHQAVERVGDGLQVAAQALDGVIEAVEHTRDWVFGVQWHPEDPRGPESDRLRLVSAFVEEAAARRAGAASPLVGDPR